jgi:hypothetical protein
MSQTILIRCDLFPGSGAGHLKRCSIIAGALSEFGYAPVFLLDTASGPLPINIDFPIERLDGPFDETSDARAVAGLAMRYGTQVVLGDSYRISADWVGALRSTGLIVALMDDLGVGGDASLRIDYSPLPKRLRGTSRSLLGASYFVTDSPRLPNRSAPPKRMIAHAGGTGNFAAAKEVYAAAARVAKEARVVLTWLCPNDAAREWLGASGLYDPADKILGWQKGRSDIWSEFDIVVGPASTSLFEVILQGALPISFPISSTQSSCRGSWLQIGHALHLTNEEIASCEIAEAMVRLALDHYGWFRTVLDDYARELDGQGAARVVTAIADLASGKMPNVVDVSVQPVSIRECDIRDTHAFLIARNAPSFRELSTNPDHIIGWAEHLRWWLVTYTERFVVCDEEEPKAFFWHRPETISGRDYLIGGWFPAGNQPAFDVVIRLLNWQLEYCAERYPDHMWLATINKGNRAVLALNRRYGFVNADDKSYEALKHLFPGTTEDFVVLQRKACMS